MTILPAKRAATSAEENKDTSTQNVNATRRDHNISHTSSLNDASSNRRPFRRKSTTPEPSECLRKRFKVRRKQQRDNRDRKGKRLETPEETLETAAAPPSSEISEVVAPDCEQQLNLNIEADEGTGFNSEDEYGPTLGNLKDRHLTDEEWTARDALFARCLQDLGYEIKQMHEDGACLFRAIADQIYGDQELHYMVRSSCMDYIVKNKDFFAPYVTEDFDKYVTRKRKWNVHGNHLEIQAMSEMYNRTIEVYCYQIEPINIFNGSRINTDEPIRLSYHRMCHYNSISNPNNPSVGVGLGLPSYHPIDLNRRRLVDAVRASEELLIEQTMLEDKIKATDWEATNEALEEEVARESYIQYFRDAERRLKPQNSACAGSSSTVTSAVCSSPRANRRGSMSPKGASSPKGNASPKASSPKCHRMSPRNLNHCGNNDFEPTPELKPSTSVSYQEFSETKTNNAEISKKLITPDGDEDWDDGIMAQVLAESRNTYLDELKRNSKRRIGSPGPSTSS